MNHFLKLSLAGALAAGWPAKGFSLVCRNDFTFERCIPNASEFYDFWALGNHDGLKDCKWETSKPFLGPQECRRAYLKLPKCQVVYDYVAKVRTFILKGKVVCIQQIK